jgi:replicative DNA helicase
MNAPPDHEAVTALPAFRQPPHNFEAEKALLGAIMADNTAFEAVAGYLKPEHFADPVHGRIYEVMSGLVEKRRIVDIVTLNEYFEQDALLVDVGGVEYLAEIAGSMVSIINAREYGRILHDLALKRLLIDIGEQIVNQAFSPDTDKDASTLVDEAEQALLAVSDSGQVRRGARLLKDHLNDGLRDAQTAMKAGDDFGVSIGLTDVDQMMGKMLAGDLIVLAGATSMGKTALGFQITRHAAENGLTAFKASLEMTGSQLAMRAVADGAGVSTAAIRSGRIDEADFKALFAAAGDLQGLPIYIDDRPALSIGAIRVAAERIRRRHGLGLIVVDYLQLMEGTGSNRVAEITGITHGLKSLAKNLEVPVIAMAQLSRAVDQRDDHRPRLSDLRESGSIEQDADTILLIFRTEYYLQRETTEPGPSETEAAFMDRLADLEKARGKAEIIIAKNRHGPTGSVKVHFNAERMRFGNLTDTTP